MLNTKRLLLLAVMMSTAQLMAQSIDIGTIHLNLGMPENVALQKLADDYDVKPVGHGNPNSPVASWIVVAKGHPAEAHANVAFQNGQLTSVFKYWTINERNTEADFANAIYGAATSLKQQGATACSLGTQQSQSPEITIKTVSITCGQRAISIAITHEPDQRAESATVTEMLRLSK